MGSNATPDPDHLLDELVPPPGPAWRRAAGWLLFLGALVGVGWAWTSGTAAPILRSYGWSYGGEGPVQMTVVMTNDSRVAVEVLDGPGAHDGVELLGYQARTGPDAANQGIDPEPDEPFDADPFPVRVEPGDDLIVIAWYAVTDCDAIAAETGDLQQIEVRARIADGPFSVRTHVRQVDAPIVEDETWVQAMTAHACT